MRQIKEDNILLASLAVFRELYNAEKDVYGIISVFLNDLIGLEQLYSFDSNEITNKLNDTFEFDIPKAVVEVANYELTYSGDLLAKVTQYNPDGSLDIVGNIKNNGKTKIRDWYRNEKLTEQSTTEYLTEFLKERFYGWEIRDGIKTEWDYKFKYEFDNGRVKSHTRYVAEMEKETVKYFYDEKGLLLKTEGYAPDFFEYIKY
jgi:hypothetical protein